jgi:ABC-type nitrate/sulfonate/bicarbonate transport system substrate-binding protein
MVERGRKGSALSRRTFLKDAGVAALGLSSAAVLPSPARAQLKKVKLSLPWLPDSNYSYAFVARNQGLWRKRGLDVELSRGNGSLTVGQAVHAKQFDVGIIGASAVMLLAARGLDLLSIGLIDYNATMGVAVLDDSPIRQPKDLEGKTVGQTVASSDAAFFPVFCDRTNVDLAKVNRVSMDANVRTRTLWERKVDAITGFANSILPASYAAGHKTRYMLYDDYGIKLYSDTVIVKPEFFRENRQICEAVVEGIHEGMLFHITQPEATLKIYLQEVKEMAMSQTAEDFARVGIGILMFSVLSEPGVQQNGLGWADPKKLDDMMDLVMKYQAPPGTARPDREKIFRVDFAGRYRATPAQWQAARTYIKDITALMRPASASRG